MTDPVSFTRSAMELASVAVETEIEVWGRKWALMPGVFNPEFFTSTGIFDALIDYPAGGSFLEIGCGAGLIAVRAALAGCEQVWATDINSRAVENTLLNAERHGVASKVASVQCYLFDGLPEGKTFDVIFWNSNFIYQPESDHQLSDYEQAFFDPGYKAHERFLRDAPSRLRPGGRLLMGFSDLGNLTELLGRLDAAGVTARSVGRTDAEDGHAYDLYWLVPSDSHEVITDRMDV